MAALAPAGRLRAWLRWHRRVGLAACAALLLWSLSGALHPLLSRYQLPPASLNPPRLSVPPPGAPALSAVLARAGIDTVEHARLVQLAEGPAWQVGLPGQRRLRYFDAGLGAEIAEGEARHAEALARHYLGDSRSALRETRRVEAFGGEYPWVNRLLPVYRVAFDRPDGMRAYVEPRSGLLATLLDERKADYNRLFVLLHTWRVPGLPEPLRLAVAGIALLAVVLTPLLGIAVWRARGGLPATGGARRAHRLLGLTAALMVLASALSGAWHLTKGALDRRAQRELPVRVAHALPAASLATDRIRPGPGPLLSLTLVDLGGRVHARLVSAAPAPAADDPGEPSGANPTGAQGPGAGAPPAHAAHAPAPADPSGRRAPTVLYQALEGGPTPAGGDIDYALALAAALVPRCEPARAAFCLEGAPSATGLITGFGGEYGFVNKLLPVWRLEAGAGRLYVHTETGTLAARVSPADYAEGWSFGTLHKWQWLEFLGKGPRDTLQVLWALMAAGAAVLGLVLLRNRRAGRAN